MAQLVDDGRVLRFPTPGGVVEDFIAGRNLATLGVNSPTSVSKTSDRMVPSSARRIDPADCEPSFRGRIRTPSRRAFSTVRSSSLSMQPPRTSNGFSTSGGKGRASEPGSVSVTSNTNITGPMG